jgi:hypothetical protein
VKIRNTIKLGMAVIALITTAAVTSQAHTQNVLIDRHIDLHLTHENQINLVSGNLQSNLHAKKLSFNNHTLASG